jgi:opacity protein-like surface antigen
MIRGPLDVASGGLRETRSYRDTYRFARGFEATGYGIAYSVLTGAEYHVADTYCFTADLGYRFASVGKLPVDNVDGMTCMHKNETLL